MDDVGRARAVILAARENDVWEQDIPEDDDELVAQAKQIVEDAEAYERSGRTNAAVTAVMFAWQVTGGSDNGTHPQGDAKLDVSDLTIKQLKVEVEKAAKKKDFDYINEIVESEEKGKNRKSFIRWMDESKILNKEEDLVANNTEKTLDEEFDKVVEKDIKDEEYEQDKSISQRSDEEFEAKQKALAEVKKNNLPIPETPDAPVSSLSDGLAEASMKELQESLNDAGLALAHSTWLSSLSQIDKEYAKRVAERYFNKALKRVSDDAKNRDTAIALAEEDDHVVEWRDKQGEAQAQLTLYQGLKEISKGHYDTVSRIFAMKQEERERG